MNHLVFVLSWIYIYPWFDYCPSPSCLKRWANPCLSLINWVNPYLLNNANGITRTAIGMTNKQKHAQFHHVAVPLSEPCRQMSLSEPKHTNTTVLLLLGANYNSKWIFFLCVCVWSWRGVQGIKTLLPASPESWETLFCVRATDAYYWFTLWPRKQLIVYAEPAWHLTIR